LMELIDANKEINDLNASIKQCLDHQTEADNELKAVKLRIDDLLSAQNAFDESMQKLENGLDIQIQNETTQILDKYELWMKKTMQLFMEEILQKNESLSQTQKFLILKVFDNEVKSKSSPNVIDKVKTRRKHVSTPSTPMLGQSFTTGISLEQLEQSGSDSSDDETNIVSPHGQNILQINIQQNIFNSANYTKTKTKKRNRKRKSLRLKRQTSNPIKTTSYGAGAEEDILCTIDSPDDNEVVVPGKKLQKRRRSRKRSNSFTVESPSKLKVHAFEFNKPEAYLE